MNPKNKVIKITNAIVLFIKVAKNPKVIVIMCNTTITNGACGVSYEPKYLLIKGDTRNPKIGPEIFIKVYINVLVAPSIPNRFIMKSPHQKCTQLWPPVCNAFAMLHISNS